MANKINIPPLDGSIIQRISFIDFIQRDDTCPFKSSSLPAHLLHLIIEGEIQQNVNGHIQHVTAGQVVWYYEDEQITGEIKKTPWKFYTVNFFAPLLSPPMYDQRIIPADSEIYQGFEALYQIWRDTDAPAMRRHIQLHEKLLSLLVNIIPDENLNHRIDSMTNIWWKIEDEFRKDLSQHFDLQLLEKKCHCSKRTIIRSCHAATNTSPIKRLKEIRLSYAQGLVLHSDLSITDISYKVGYTRIQELSRDYCKRFGKSPTEDRKNGPYYKEINP